MASGLIGHQQSCGVPILQHQKDNRSKIKIGAPFLLHYSFSHVHPFLSLVHIFAQSQIIDTFTLIYNPSR